jgi:hypothetical protein
MDGSVVNCGGHSTIVEIGHDDPGTPSPAQVDFVFNNGPDVCECPYQGDLDANGLHDAVDLNILIDVLFFNEDDPQDPCCPTTRGDLFSDGATDATDLNYMIDLLFFNGPNPHDPCQ